MRNWRLLVVESVCGGRALEYSTLVGSPCAAGRWNPKPFLGSRTRPRVSHQALSSPCARPWRAGLARACDASVWESLTGIGNSKKQAQRRGRPKAQMPKSGSAGRFKSVR